MDYRPGISAVRSLPMP